MNPVIARAQTHFLFVTLSLLTLHCRQDEVSAESEPPPIEIKATVHPAQSITITAPIDGKVQSIAAREGAKIGAGGEIVQLLNPTVERDVAVTRSQLQWIESRQRGAGQQRALPAPPRDNLEIVVKILEMKKQRLEKMRELRRSNDVTARELEYAEVEYLAALRDYNNERRAAIVTPAPRDDGELLRIEREKVIAEERFATQRQSLLRITAPFSGIVTRLHVVPGQVVFLRDPIADVSDVATLHVRGEVAPELLRYLRPGMRVDVKVYNVPPRTFADEIEYIVPVQSTGSESRAATVIVTIPNPDGSLQPNTQALITLRALR